MSGACINYADDVANLERVPPEVGFVFAGFVFCINLWSFVWENYNRSRGPQYSGMAPPHKVGISIIYTSTYSCKEVVPSPIFISEMNKTRLCPSP